MYFIAFNVLIKILEGLSTSGHNNMCSFEIEFIKYLQIVIYLIINQVIKLIHVMIMYMVLDSMQVKHENI